MDWLNAAGGETRGCKLLRRAPRMPASAKHERSAGRPHRTRLIGLENGVRDRPAVPKRTDAPTS